MKTTISHLWSAGRLILVLQLIVSGTAKSGLTTSSLSQAGTSATPLRDGLLNPQTVEPITTEEFQALLKRWQGNVVLVNLWATWCVPCIREFPDLSKLQEQYGERGVKVIGISPDEPDALRTKVKPFVQERSPCFATYHSQEPDSEKFIAHLDPGFNGIIPTTYVLDRQGKLKATLMGRKTYEEFEAVVKPLLEATNDPLAGASAIELVRAAIAAHGGQAFHHPRSIQLKGRAVYHPLDGSPDILIDSLTITRLVPQASISARNPGGKLRVEAWVNGRLFFRQGYDGTKLWSEVGDQARPIAEYLQLDRHFGFGIIRFAETPGFVVERWADDEVEGRPAYHISITDLEKRRTDFWIDKETRLIHKVAFDTLSGHHERIYWPYDLKDEVKEARRVKLIFRGHTLFDVMWDTVTYNLDFPPDFFDPPADALLLRQTVGADEKAKVGRQK
ncbi:MAG: TlpA disulfide reductase family protein [Candidatus Hadarchaeum sp.]